MTEAEDTEDYEEAKTLGLERWVQFAFVAIAGLTFFIGDKLINFIWSYFADPKELLISGVSAILGLLTGYLLYRHPTVRPLADEVAMEMSKVTWPSRRETWYSTLVVIITSVIAAVYLGLFDTLWSAFTDLIYATS
jgi:preprotein translocase subunit SecE